MNRCAMVCFQIASRYFHFKSLRVSVGCNAAHGVLQVGTSTPIARCATSASRWSDMSAARFLVAKKLKSHCAQMNRCATVCFQIASRCFHFKSLRDNVGCNAAHGVLQLGHHIWASNWSRSWNGTQNLYVTRVIRTTISGPEPIRRCSNSISHVLEISWSFWPLYDVIIYDDDIISYMMTSYMMMMS